MQQRGSRLPLAAACLWVLPVVAVAAELPAGTPIQIRLETKVASNKTKPGEEIQAVVIEPVMAAGQIVIPAGSKLKGKLKEGQASKSETEPAALALQFGELVGAKPVKLPAKVVAVDNARETVDEAGRILGIAASETLTAQMDRGLEKLEKRVSGLAAVLQAAKSAVLKQADVEIDYQPGAEMTLQLTKSVQVSPPAAPAGASPRPIRGEMELAALVNRQPVQTRAQKPPLPSDITNLMFLGAQECLETAFAAAGWVPPEKLNAKSGLETFRAIAENRGYSQAPVSTLLLDGRPPDLVFQKQNNTFAKRHHLRIWKLPVTFAGQSVWLAAATHDIGIEFSPENRTFIHKIDPQIDRERAKVVSDLLLTGTVKGLALVERPAAPRESRNATGDNLETDGSVAVLQFQ